MTGHFQLTKAFKSFPFTLLHTLLHGAKINPLLFNRFRTLSEKRGVAWISSHSGTRPRQSPARRGGPLAASIHPLSFLLFAHSLAQWALDNSFVFKRFCTLSIATEVWGVVLASMTKGLLPSPMRGEYAAESARDVLPFPGRVSSDC